MHRCWDSWPAWRSFWAPALLALAVTLFHARGLRPENTFLAADLAQSYLPWRSASPPPARNVLASDPLFEFLPFVQSAVASVRERGEWLQWNDAILLGHPSFADPLAEPLYPVFLVFGFVAGAARGLALADWAHAVFAALCTYGYLRTVGRSRLAGMLGGMAYALGGYMVNWLELTYWLATLSWFPALLWAYEAGVRRAPSRGRRGIALMGLATAAAALGGHLQLLVDFALFLGLYAAGRTIWRWWQRPAIAALWPLVLLLAGLALGGLLSAALTVPFAEALATSIRPGAQQLADALPVRQLATFVMPALYGTPAQSPGYWGSLNYLEGTAYAGISTLLLACLAPFCTRRFEVRLLAALAVLTVLFAAGAPGVSLLNRLPLVRYGSLHRAIFLVPLLAGILAATTLDAPRVRPRAVFIVAVALLVVPLAALALDHATLAPHWADVRLPLLRAILLLATTGALVVVRERRSARRSLASGGIAALVFLDLFVAGWRLNPAGPVAQVLPPTPGIEFLRAGADEAASGGARVAILQTADVPLIGPNVLSLYGVAEAGGYTSIPSNGLLTLIEQGDPKGDAPGIGRAFALNRNIVFFSHPTARLLDVLHVDYVAAPQPVTYLSAEWREAYGGEFFVYERATPQPRAFVVYAAEQITDEGKAKDRLLESFFDLANSAVTTVALGLPTRLQPPADAATIVAHTPSRVEIAATARQAGLLVLADAYHPGWQAEVDGGPATVLRVDEVYRGVALAPGEHRIVFRLAPASLTLGRWLSAAGLAIVGLLLLPAAALRWRHPHS